MIDRDTEQLARVLCTLAGHDADERCAPHRLLALGPKGYPIVPNESAVQAWGFYVDEAKACLDWIMAGKPDWQRPDYVVGRSV